MNEPIVKTSFDVEIAKKVGIDAAILLANIEFWCEKNKANNKNYRDDAYWTYNSQKAFLTLFPWMSDDRIFRNLNKLIKEGYLRKANYNNTKMDRTSWYSVIPRNTEMDSAEVRNGFRESTECNIDNRLNTDETHTQGNVKNNIAIKQQAEEFLVAFNKIRATHFESTKPFLKNFEYWLESYSVEKMILAVKRSYLYDWFDEVLTPTMLLRTSNKGGTCDYIGDLLSRKVDRSEAEASDIALTRGGVLE